jgi:hypothetical protein
MTNDNNMIEPVSGLLSLSSNLPTESIVTEGSTYVASNTVTEINILEDGNVDFFDNLDDEPEEGQTQMFEPNVTTSLRAFCKFHHKSSLERLHSDYTVKVLDIPSSLSM